MNLDGARVLVTGGASGIGAATVALLERAGATAAVLDRRPAPGGTRGWVTCDVASEDGVVAAVRQVRQELGGLDAAVLCAGTGGYSPLLDLAADEWDRVMGVNLRGTFLCLREVGRVLADGGGGAVVAVSSISGASAERGMAHYCASKAAVDQLVRVAARELGPSGVRVNAVAPGTTDTPLFDATARIPGYRERVAGRTALGGVGPAAAVAEAVLALLRLDWVTGQVLAADGGISLWSPIDPMDGP